MKKVVLLGIDGATPDLLESWMNEGKLPHFQRIRKNGVWGKLKSTTPPFSAPAWTSIVTGCNPGKHGIYGFESTGTLEPHLINSRDRKVPAIWNYLTDIGMKNIIVNVPGTYPPEEISGTMITGLLTPSHDSNFTYPKKIKERLTGNDLGEYELEQFWLEDFSRSRMKKRAPEKLLNHINRQMTSRLQVGLNLMKETDWDFTMIVFRGTDTAQHFLFEDKDLLLLSYQKVDELVGKITDSYPNAIFFIVSDHGFEEIKKILYPDNVLYNAKYLTPYKDPHSSLVSQLYPLIHRVVNYFLKLFLTPHIDQPNIGGLLFILLYTTLELDGILIFFTFFLVGTVIGEIIYEIFLIEDKNERRTAMKNRFLLPLFITGTILLIVGILFDYPEFLNAWYRSFPWMIYSLGWHLILISVLISIEERGLFQTKKNYRFLFYFSYYSFTVYISHYLLTLLFERQLTAYNIWIYIIITIILYNTLFRILYKTLKQKASIKAQINNLSVKITRKLEERKKN